MKNSKFDIIVIGSGPGGYVAAIKAARRGTKVAIIEEDTIGGTCLNIGCIPTKTLIASTKVLSLSKSALDFGVKINGTISPDWKVMLERKDTIVNKLRSGIDFLLKSAGVKIIKGTASFIDKNNISVSTGDDKKKSFYAEKYILAVGSKPSVPGFIPKSERIMTSKELLSISDIPKSLLILGGGVIGCEFACLFSELGTEVTIVEMLPSLLPNIDKDISENLTKRMRSSGIKIITGKALERVTTDADSVLAVVAANKIKADYMLVSIGRVPHSDKLKLENTHVYCDNKGWVPVDTRCRTNIRNIYAIGDMTGNYQLAHAASAMGITAAENATGSRSFFNNIIPGCIFTNPEIGTVGLSEKDCREQGIEYRTGQFPFSALGKAMAIGNVSGFCKIIAHKETDQILGVHIIGPHATDLISEAVTGMKVEITAKELGDAIHAHPTLGEIMMEAAHAVHGKSIHLRESNK